MGKITAIKAQVKRPDRVSIYVDEKYRFSLSKDQAAGLNLSIGQELSSEQIDSLKDDSKFGKLRDNTYRWLALRPRSEFEIQQYLKRKTTDQTLIDRVLELLASSHYIDDAKFAASWVQHRTLIKPISQRRLRQELLQKRIPAEIIEQTLENTGLDDLEAVKQLIIKRAHRYSDQQKLMAYLARQGFNYDTIKTALSELSDD